jgi:hypothetical protein
MNPEPPNTVIRRRFIDFSLPFSTDGVLGHRLGPEPPRLSHMEFAVNLGEAAGPAGPILG